MTRVFTESVVEDAALAWLESLGYAVLHGPVIAATIEAGLLKADESVGGSQKFARYLPFWA